MGALYDNYWRFKILDVAVVGAFSIYYGCFFHLTQAIKFLYKYYEKESPEILFKVKIKSLC